MFILHDLSIFTMIFFTNNYLATFLIFMRIKVNNKDSNHSRNKKLIVKLYYKVETKLKEKTS